MNRIHSGTGAE